MAASTALVDATRHAPGNSADTEVAGLGMLERTIRLADVSGCDRAIVIGASGLEASVERIRRRLTRDERFEIGIQFFETAASSFSDVVADAAAALESAGFEYDRVLYLDSTTVYQRELIGECIDRAARIGGFCLPQPSWDAGAGQPRAFAASWQTWSELAGASESFDSISDLRKLASGRTRTATVSSSDDAAPWVRVVDASSADRAAGLIWEACHKSEDGPVGRHINRPISLAISRRIAPYDVSPNQISVVAGLFGLATGPVAAAGGYVAFLVAAIFYQIKSIVDGSDGEIARAKYEFTDSGAWVDKIFDDLSDLSFAVGAGIGVWSMGIPGPSVTGTEFWLGVIALTIVGKLVDSVVFYGNGYRDGELVHPKEIFDWSFEEDDEGEGSESTGEKILAYVKPITRGDVFIFLALLCAIGGIIPTYLAIFAVGQVSVGISRVRQARLQGRHRAQAAANDASPEPTTR